ncbi:glycosyltransferase family 2 protein, partial [Verrucomicrobiota bacterium]
MPTAPSPAGSLAPLTAVISTHNRAPDLARTLEGLLALGYPELRTIVADNASVDGTPELVRKIFPGVQVLRQSDNLPLRGYNLAFDAVRTPYVLVLDDDSCPRPGTLERLTA